MVFQVLEPFLPDADQPFLREFFEVNMQYSMFGEWLEVRHDKVWTHICVTEEGSDGVSVLCV